MHSVDEFPILLLHVLEAAIPKDTGIVDEDIDTAKIADGSLDDLLAVLDAVVVGDGLTAGGLDLVDYDIGSLQENALLVTSSQSFLFSHFLAVLQETYL